MRKSNSLSCRRLCFAALALVAVGGCVREPTIALHSAGIRGVGTQGVTLSMTLAVRNDNSFDVMVRNVTTDVTLADRFRLPTVTYSPNVWLPSDKTTLVSVPVVIPWALIGPVLATTVASPAISYRAVGHADVTATRALEIDVNEYALSEEGSFSRGELLQAAQTDLQR
jgi:LEA14-like dessication related protein